MANFHYYYCILFVCAAAASALVDPLAVDSGEKKSPRAQSKETNDAASSKQDGVGELSASSSSSSVEEGLKANCSYHTIVKSSFVLVADAADDANGTQTAAPKTQNIVCRYEVCRGASGKLDESTTIKVDGKTRAMSAQELAAYKKYAHGAPISGKRAKEAEDSDKLIGSKWIEKFFEMSFGAVFNSKAEEQPCFCASCNATSSAR